MQFSTPYQNYLLLTDIIFELVKFRMFPFSNLTSLQATTFKLYNLEYFMLKMFLIFKSFWGLTFIRGTIFHQKRRRWGTYLQ